ncbi:MAG: MBL fold metallo-hydrolase [Candidatus Zixiibacteriota bacterium]|nr:MAG: MBL fold metallo-hydrolase [candidate division Zixibacteria bacterium]
MKNPVHLLVLGLMLMLSVCAEQQEQSPLTITYVANEGFLIECDGRKILIDALFGGWESTWCHVPPDSLIELMTSARPPFDNVDLIAVSHAHIDHCDAGIIALHMKHNRRGILVCPPHVARRMEASEDYPEIKSRIRVVPAPGDSAVAMELAGIALEVLPTRHGPYWEKDEETGEDIDRHRNVQHLEFVFTIGGRTLFHCGDSSLDDFESYRAFGMDRKHIDLGFLGWWGAWDDSFLSQRLVREVIRPERIIFMHLKPGQRISVQPEQQQSVAREVIVPQQVMETWTID